MINRSTPSKSQRIGVLVSVVVLHLGLFIAFLASKGAATPPVVKSGAMSLIAINAEVPAQRSTSPPRLTSKLVNQIRKMSAAAANVAPDSAATSAPAGQCGTLDLVTRAIVADPVAVAAVIDAPPETRSIAEAIVMWNAGWSNFATSAESPLNPTRLVVEQSLASVEDLCLDEPIAGPRLIPIPVADSQRTMFLVFGSGNWTWRELLATPAPVDGTVPDANDKKPWYEFDWFQAAIARRR